MISRDGSTLLIFEDFRVDYNLPKNRVVKDTVYMDGSMTLTSNRATLQSSLEQSSGDFDPEIRIRRKLPWYKRLFKERDKGISINSFFTSVKNSMSELSMVAERAKSHEAAMIKAKQTGQTALFEKLSQGLVAVRSETQLVSMGMGKYIDESAIVGFVKKSKRDSGWTG